MNLEISGHHVKVTPAMHEYVEKKIERLERHGHDITKIHVILKIEEPNKHTAEATVHVKQKDIFASADQESMYAAIDLLVDKLDKQLRQYKDILIDRQHGDSA